MQRRNINKPRYDYNFQDCLEFTNITPGVPVTGGGGFIITDEFANGSVSVSTWFRFNSHTPASNNHSTIMGTVSGATNGSLYERIQPNGTNGMRIRWAFNTNHVFRWAGLTYANNVWYHLLVTYDDVAQLTRAYMDGVESDNGAESGIQYISALRQFGSLRGSRPLDGKLDDFIVWEGYVGTLQNAIDLSNEMRPNQAISQKPSSWWRFNGNLLDSGTNKLGHHSENNYQFVAH